MKKILIFSLFVVVAATFSLGQNKGAVIKFDKTMHDYGTVYQGADGSCEFTFKNEGDEPLTLTSARSSCGCTVPKWPKEPILPGQTGVIQVTYDTKRLGVISKQVTVLSNATESSVILNIKGNVLQKPSEILPEKPVNNGFTPSAN